MLVPLPPRRPKVRKRLSADALYAVLYARFAQLPQDRPPNAVFPLADVLQSAFALFALKDPSLLAFDARRRDANLQALFGIGRIPCDTQLRTILDDVPPDDLRPAFTDLFRELQRGKALEPYVFHDGAYLLSLDGTGYFSSQVIHCGACLEKVHQRTGQVTYEHQMLAAVLIHPDHREVFPLAPEPIQKQDGSTKNDCERNAAKRLLRKLRADHPHLPLIVVEDGLASNAPHIRLLQELSLHFLLGVKPGDHTFLFDRVTEAYDRDRVTTRSWRDGDVHCELSFVNGVPLNESNPDLLVNFLQYAEYGPDGEIRASFAWVTDLRITRANARHLMRGGRARWKIENETFNTLKNQGYRYEHNFGHGKRHLSVVLASLMMLAFLVDQVQQRCCPVFRAALAKVGSKRALWDHVRSHFRHFAFRSMRSLYEAILYDLAKELPPPELPPSFDTS
jgi:hypothetical protein